MDLFELTWRTGTPARDLRLVVDDRLPPGPGGVGRGRGRARQFTPAAADRSRFGAGAEHAGDGPLPPAAPHVGGLWRQLLVAERSRPARDGRTGRR